MKKSLWLVLTVGFLLSPTAIAQKHSGTTFELARALWVCCLTKKFPNAEHAQGASTGYDPDSHRNFAWDVKKQAWIDVKTLEVICPKSTFELARALWVCCLTKKFPNAEHAQGANTGYDPDSHRNFACDVKKQAWIDVKTGKCICPECEEKRTAHAPPPTPTPSTTDKVTDILKTIGGSISIDVGGGTTGGGDHRHGGDDRHRIADKVPTSKKTTTGTSHKTVTAGCKCHPCTCSPCTCH